MNNTPDDYSYKVAFISPDLTLPVEGQYERVIYKGEVLTADGSLHIYKFLPPDLSTEN